MYTSRAEKALTASSSARLYGGEKKKTQVAGFDLCQIIWYRIY